MSEESLNISQTYRKIILCPICKSKMEWRGFALYYAGYVAICYCPVCGKRIEWRIKYDGSVDFDVFG